MFSRIVAPLAVALTAGCASGGGPGEGVPPRRAASTALACMGPTSLPEPILWIEPVDPAQAASGNWCAAVGPPAVVRASAYAEGATPTGTAGCAACAPGQGDSLIIVSWNVHVGGGDVLRLVQDLRRGLLTGSPVHSFVLLLQEVHRSGPEVPRGGPGGDLAARISSSPREGPRTDVVEAARALGLHLFYAPSMPNGLATPESEGEDRGNAILSTLPLSELAAIELPFERQRRVAVAATVRGRDASGAPWTLRVASGHLDPRSRWGRVLDSFGMGRARQARALAGALVGEAVALGADLNTWSPAFMEGALDILHARFPETPPLSGSTFAAAGLIGRQLDHLLFRLPDSHAARARRVDERYGSDHHPILGVVRFGRAAPARVPVGVSGSEG